MLKRVFDLMIAIPLFLLTLLIAPILFIATRVDSPGPVLFSQIRVGLGQKEFRLFISKADKEPKQVPVGTFQEIRW